MQKVHSFFKEVEPYISTFFPSFGVTILGVILGFVPAIQKPLVSHFGWPVSIMLFVPLLVWWWQFFKKIFFDKTAKETRFAFKLNTKSDKSLDFSPIVEKNKNIFRNNASASTGMLSSGEKWIDILIETNSPLEDNSIIKVIPLNGKNPPKYQGHLGKHVIFVRVFAVDLDVDGGEYEIIVKNYEN